MKFYKAPKRLLSGFLVLVIVFSTFLLPITLGVKPALAISTLELTYPGSNIEPFYKKIATALGKKENLIIHTTFFNYSEFPNDLKDFIGQTKEGTFELNPNAKAFNRIGSYAVIGTTAAFVCGIFAGILGGDPQAAFALCGGAALGIQHIFGEDRANAKYQYLVTMKQGDIFLHVVQ